MLRRPQALGCGPRNDARQDSRRKARIAGAPAACVSATIDLRCADARLRSGFSPERGASGLNNQASVRRRDRNDAAVSFRDSGRDTRLRGLICSTDTRKAAGVVSEMVKLVRKRRVITKSWLRRECGFDPNGVNERRR
jgi:hypothetical protein